MLRLSKPRTSHVVLHPIEKMIELQATHCSPTNIIQFVMIFRNFGIGIKNLSKANIMIGTKQMIVLTVLAEKIAIPCRFLRIFLNNEMIRQATGGF